MARSSQPLGFRRLKNMVLKIPAEHDKIREDLLGKGWEASKDGEDKLTTSIEFSPGNKASLVIEGNTLIIAPAGKKPLAVDKTFIVMLEHLIRFSMDVAGDLPRPIKTVLVAEGASESVRRRLREVFPDGRVPLLGWYCPWELKTVPGGMELFLGKGRSGKNEETSSPRERKPNDE